MAGEVLADVGKSSIVRFPLPWLSQGEAANASVEMPMHLFSGGLLYQRVNT